MRAPHSPTSLLAAAVLCAAAAHPVAAQQAAAPVAPRPVVERAEAADAPVLRTLATYRFAGWRDGDMPAEVTVADSAGALVASFRPTRARAASPMMVSLIDTDIVLQGETTAGVLTLRLYRQNDPATAGTLEGQWWLGERHGELRGATRVAAAAAPPR
jgi:hypothetical protein